MSAILAAAKKKKKKLTADQQEKLTSKMDELLECEQQYKKQRETGISDGMIAGIVSRSHWATSSVRNEDIHFDI